MAYKTWHFTNVYDSAIIGDGTVIGSYTEVGDRVKIGKNCKVEAMVFIPKGVTIGDNVFIGPKVCFVNDKYPKATGEWRIYETKVEDGVSIGANSTIVCGVTLGRNCGVASGSVVTKSIPPGEVWAGNPARRIDSAWKKD